MLFMNQPYTYYILSLKVIDHLTISWTKYALFIWWIFIDEWNSIYKLDATTYVEIHYRTQEEKRFVSYLLKLSQSYTGGKSLPFWLIWETVSWSEQVRHWCLLRSARAFYSKRKDWQKLRRLVFCRNDGGLIEGPLWTSRYHIAVMFDRFQGGL